MLKNRLDMHAVQQDWAARGFSCELWVDPPGQVWSDFVHDVDEVVHVVDGAIQIEMAGRVLRLEPGEELLIPAGSHHTVRNIGAATSRWLYGYRQGAAAGG